MIETSDNLRVPAERQLSIVLHAQYGADCERRVRNSLAARYRATAGTVWEAIATLTTANGSVPALAVVHSPQSLPRLLTLDTESVLVYDQHLGQVFSRLTRLTLGRAEPLLVDSYLAKLAGVRLLSRGRWQSAAAFAYMSVSFRDQAVSRQPAETEGDRSRRHRLTSAQEVFVIGHELAHHLRSAEPEVFASFDEDVETVLKSWHEAERTELGADDMVEELTRSAAAVWERRHGPLEPDEIAQIRKGFADQADDDPMGADRRTTFDTFMNDSQFREEATCDVLAGLATIPVLVRGGLPATEAVEAVGYALHHLRLIQTINLVADGHGHEVLTRGLWTSMHRLTILRVALGYLIDVIYRQSIVTQERCHEIMTAVNLLHSEIVGDELLWHTSFTLREALGISDHDRASSHEVVREILGFGS